MPDFSCLDDRFCAWQMSSHGKRPYEKKKVPASESLSDKLTPTAKKPQTRVDKLELQPSWPPSKTPQPQTGEKATSSTDALFTNSSAEREAAQVNLITERNPTSFP